MSKLQSSVQVLQICLEVMYAYLNFRFISVFWNYRGNVFHHLSMYLLQFIKVQLVQRQLAYVVTSALTCKFLSFLLSVHFLSSLMLQSFSQPLCAPLHTIDRWACADDSMMRQCSFADVGVLELLRPSNCRIDLCALGMCDYLSFLQKICFGIRIQSPLKQMMIFCISKKLIEVNTELRMISFLFVMQAANSICTWQTNSIIVSAASNY